MNALAYSIATAAVAGLLTGFAMKPGSALADRPVGPQILISGANNRTIDNDGWYATSPLSSYNGQLPEYVVGSDRMQQTYDVADAAPAPAPVEEAAADPGDFATPMEAPAEPKPVKAHTPSQDGDILAGLHDDDGPQVIRISAASDARAS